MVFVVDTAKVSMETKHCRVSHNKIERQHRASDLRARNTSIIISLPCVQYIWWDHAFNVHAILIFDSTRNSK